MPKLYNFLKYTLLWPVSKVYGLVVYIRNKMFDNNLLKQQSFKVPVVVVGNIAVGGSGKTPHTEYIVSQLYKELNIGVLSRGYKRKTKGFVLARPDSHHDAIGDEPYQIYHKFGGKVMVAVCEDRVAGINQMLKLNPDLEMIVLDDAFQHRYVKPSVSVVLTEYLHSPFDDALLPFGRLREPLRALNRADIVVVTKCPPDVKPMDFRVFKEQLNLYPYQKLVFSTYEYLDPKPVFPDAGGAIPPFESLTGEDILISLTGIANPRPFVRYLRTFRAKVKILRFDDHHQFSPVDMQSVIDKWRSAGNRRKYILTTEKDAVRLAESSFFPENLKPWIFYLPIEVKILPNSDVELAEGITHIIRSKI